MMIIQLPIVLVVDGRKNTYYTDVELSVKNPEWGWGMNVGPKSVDGQEVLPYFTIPLDELDAAVEALKTLRDAMERDIREKRATDHIFRMAERSII